MSTTESAKVDDTQAKWQSIKLHKRHKLHPYVLDKDLNTGKYKPHSFNNSHRTTGNGARTGARNANRSMRKAVRQEVKKQIKKEIQNNL